MLCYVMLCYVMLSVCLSGMAWHGMAWHGMAWHGMPWHGMAWHAEVDYGLMLWIDSKERGIAQSLSFFLWALARVGVDNLDSIEVEVAQFF